MKRLSYHVELIRKQNTNTWIHLKSYDNSIINIRHVFRKLSLRVNRLIRTRYGPFTLGNSTEPGEINEVEIPRTIGNYLYELHKDKLNKKLEKLDSTRHRKREKEVEFEDSIIKKMEEKKRKLLI